AADIATWLCDDLLVKLDRMTMAHSVEGRAPYLAPDLVSAALNLPQRRRMTKSTVKCALRRVAKRYLPEEMVNRRKRGFVLPMRSWLEAWFKSHGTPQLYFRNRGFPYLNPDQLSDLVSADLAVRVQRERLLFAIVMLVEWWMSFRSRR